MLNEWRSARLEVEKKAGRKVAEQDGSYFKNKLRKQASRRNQIPPPSTASLTGKIRRVDFLTNTL
jgi:hypothetical protein